MRAVGVTAFGGSDKLQVLEIPDLDAGPGEVRLRVTAFAVNPTDTYLPLGAYATEPVPQFPYVPGMDVAGVVDQVGDDVDHLSVGDLVIAMVLPRGAHGAYRESLVLPAAAVALAPHGVSDVAASTLPMNGLTARLALDLLALRPSATVAVTGAAGAFGGYCVELAKADGLTVVADASDADHELVEQLGADIVVPRGDDVADHIRTTAPDGVDGLADGAVLDALVVPAVRDGGAVATVRGWKGNGERNIRFHPVWVSRYANDSSRLDTLRQQVEAGAVTLRVADVLPAHQAHRAHDLLAGGGIRGRLVLTWDD